jgi:hypothetical protein
LNPTTLGFWCWTLKGDLETAPPRLQLLPVPGLLDEKIDALNRKMFGRRSERQRVPDINAEILTPKLSICAFTGDYLPA